MFRHAGRAPPSLRRGAVPPSAAVLTVSGEADAVVPPAEVARLHEGADGARCRLLLAHGEDHTLRFTATHSAIRAWADELCAPPLKGAVPVRGLM